MPNLYALRSLEQNKFQMAKFDADFNVEAVYELTVKGSSYTCNCPASARVVKYKPCKHQRMMPKMLGAVNLNRFYDPETGNWAMPLALEDAVQDNGDLSAGIETSTEIEIGSEAQANGPIPPPAVAATAPQAQAAKVPQLPPSPPTGMPVINRRI